jgi:hypothetical protein
MMDTAKRIQTIAAEVGLDEPEECTWVQVRMSVRRTVDKAYEQYLVDECKGQQTYRSRLVKRAQSEEDRDEVVRKLN